MSVVWRKVPYRTFTKNAPTSDSAADAMTLRRLTEAMWSGPLGVGGTSGGFEIYRGWSLRYKFPP